jgi:hypothetical protein
MEADKFRRRAVRPPTSAPQEAAMNLKLPSLDRRTCHAEGCHHPIIDMDTGQIVGDLYIAKGRTSFDHSTWTVKKYATRDVSLFEKYHGSFDSHEECIAFVKGVEVVVNHLLVPAKERPSEKGAAA